jgi:hypothetical protein
LSSKAVSSELARATVFEVLGGIADTSESSSPNDRRKESSAGLQTSNVIEPLSSIETLEGGPQRAAAGSSQHRQQTAPDAANRRVSQTSVRAASASYSEYLRASNAVLNRSWFTTSSDDPGLQGDDAAPLNPVVSENEPAIAAAFDKLGQGETALIEYKSDSELFGRLANASPLLLILALERISALQGRRQQTQEKPHLRQRSERGPASH